jgi:23S rRNA (uracil1939-C5)-methyltransferase
MQKEKFKKIDKSKIEKVKSDKCKVFGKCGGCQLLNMSYEEQLKKKKDEVTKLLKPYCTVEKIIGMENPVHYRNKVLATFSCDRKGMPISGMYEENSHRVVSTDSCLLNDEKADKIIVSIRGLLKSFKIKTYNEDTGYGLLRHVLVRVGKNSGQVMVVLVLASPILPGKNNFVKALRNVHPEITSMVINVNPRHSSAVLGDKEIVIYGPGYIEDTLQEKTFRISPKSFYQINPVQTEKLYSKAIEFAGLTGKETVLDAYSGTGTIGICASDKAKKVICVELNKDAVKDAIVNAKRNNVSNIEMFNQDAGEFMLKQAEANIKMDVVFMDPPRSGSDEKFLRSLCKHAPKKVVYISCNPETLARDLKFLTKNGYKAEKAVACDMFPTTNHCECVVKLSKK